MTIKTRLARSDLSDRRWRPPPSCARSAPGAAPEAPPGGSSVDPRGLRGPPSLYVAVILRSSR
eukprot:4999389-Pyramimonas_sp.AAC.1